jgi:hypothetical protein
MVNQETSMKPTEPIRTVFSNIALMVAAGEWFRLSLGR